MVSFVITGPESTGKSDLAVRLSEHFNGLVVKEYARQYVENLSGHYTFEDVELIARQQIVDYNRARNKAGKEKPVFFDTFLIITKVWFEEVYNCCPLWLHHAIKTYKTDFALLCAPDLPWNADGVRENPHLREYLFDRYARELDRYGIPYSIVQGHGETRLLNAISIVEEFYQPVST
ncbi:MAG: AAA family ATPase [Marinilabiliaceae bacterium]